MKFTQVLSQGRELTLLGDLLDPHHPHRDNREVLTAIAEGLDDSADVFQLTESLAGRWVMIVDDSKSTTLFGDACGLRQVFYSDCSHSETWCASQAHHISRALGLPIDPQVKTEFLESAYVANDDEYWFPGDSSPFAGVRRLLPNHALDLRTRQSRRFWPSGPIASIGFDEAVERSAKLLSGQMQSGSRRFPQALPMTAGFDSRTILAATRGLSADVFYYTLLFPPLTSRHPDVAIPARMLPALGLKHHVISCPTHMTPEFAATYRGNADPAHAAAGAIAQGLFNEFPDGYACLTGHASEIARCFYYSDGHHPQGVDAGMLARYTSMSDGGSTNSLVARQFEIWLGEARDVERDYGVRILDLFYWEQRVGSWAAAGEAEWDIVHDRMPVFACRELLTTLLGVDAKYRRRPDYLLYQGIMRALWPDVLTFPINPAPSRAIRSALRRFAVVTRTDHLMRPVWQRVRRAIERTRPAPN